MCNFEHKLKRFIMCEEKNQSPKNRHGSEREDRNVVGEENR